MSLYCHLIFLMHPCRIKIISLKPFFNSSVYCYFNNKITWKPALRSYLDTLPAHCILGYWFPHGNKIKKPANMRIKPPSISGRSPTLKKRKKKKNWFYLRSDQSACKSKEEVMFSKTANIHYMCWVQQKKMQPTQTFPKRFYGTISLRCVKLK